MTLAEYYEGFHRYITGEAGNFTSQVAAEVAAAHEVGLTFEQLKNFLARRTQITSVTVALTAPTISVEVIERILSARQNGALYPKEILAQFSPREVHEKFHTEVFGSDSESPNPSFNGTPGGAR